MDRLLAVCEAPTVPAALAQGGELGWPRLTDADTQEWRTGFLGYNGGSVEVVGWRRGDAREAETLSYWVAVGPNGHTACAWSTTDPDGLLDALSQRLGEPDILEDKGAAGIVSAHWTRDAAEYSFAQVGSSAIINIKQR